MKIMTKGDYLYWNLLLGVGCAVLVWALACRLPMDVGAGRATELFVFLLLLSMAMRLPYTWRSSRTAVSTAVNLLCPLLVCAIVLGRGGMQSQRVISQPPQPTTVADSAPVLSQLREDAWRALDCEGRLEVLQVAAAVEASALGLPHGLVVVADDLEPNCLAGYRDETRQIVIDWTHLATGTGQEIWESLCHEAYHAAQHRLCDAYDSLDEEYQSLAAFTDAAVYRQELAHYIQGGDDLEGYRAQRVETDARAYSQAAVERHWAELDQACEARG